MWEAGVSRGLTSYVAFNLLEEPSAILKIHHSPNPLENLDGAQYLGLGLLIPLLPIPRIGLYGHYDTQGALVMSGV